MNLRSGHRVFPVQPRQRAQDFPAFLKEVRRHYGGRPVAILLPSPAHWCTGCTFSCWLPKRSPQLNPMDTLWGRAKDLSAQCALRRHRQQADAFIAYASGLANGQAF